MAWAEAVEAWPVPGAEAEAGVVLVGVAARAAQAGVYPLEAVLHRAAVLDGAQVSRPEALPREAFPRPAIVPVGEVV